MHKQTSTTCGSTSTTASNKSLNNIYPGHAKDRSMRMIYYTNCEKTNGELDKYTYIINKS
eukprot:4850764-Heterocapsa_arctica.AAC.1